MLCATFNANSIRARQDVLLAWLQKHSPAVLCIQETKVQDHDFPAAVFAEAGYSAVFRGEKSYNGVAILARSMPYEAVFGFDDGGSEDATRLVRARVGKLWIVNTYVPQGRALDHPMYRYKLEWFQRLRDYFDRHFTPRMPVLWCGDLNVAATPDDVHHPERQARHVCFHEDIRAAFEQCRAWGFQDVFRQLHPDRKEAYTFYDYRVRGSLDKALGWRIDYLLATPPLSRTARAADIDLEPRRQAGSSDHTFLWADFEI